MNKADDFGLKVPLGRLIERLGPLNNRCRDAEGLAKLEIMWGIGEALREVGVTHIHPVAWAIDKRSYITRDLLSYSWRIRRRWSSLEELRGDFPHLKNYEIFREALPLIENPRYRLSQDRVAEVLLRLNTDSPKDVKQWLLDLKRQVIGVRNDRQQRKNELTAEVEAVRRMIGEARELVHDGRHTESAELRHQLGQTGLLALSQLSMALANEGTAAPELPDMSTWPDRWKVAAEALSLITKRNLQTRNRFRRRISAAILLEAADILNGLRSELGTRALRARVRPLAL